MSANAWIIDLVQQELEAYRRTGCSVHLAHAARALNEALAATQAQPGWRTAEQGR